MARNNNQLTVGGRDRGDIEEEALPGWTTWGGRHHNIWGDKMERRKK